MEVNCPSPLLPHVLPEVKSIDPAARELVESLDARIVLFFVLALGVTLIARETTASQRQGGRADSETAQGP